MSKTWEQLSQRERDERKKTVAMLSQVYRERLVIDECENSLKTFLRCAWNVVEPGTPYIHGRHIDAICEHLEACVEGDIRKLIISVPPRSSKSTILAVCLPAWVWIKKPETKWIFSSYDLKLSKRDSRKCRLLIGSGWYQRWWGNRFSMSKTQDEKHRFENDKSGFRLATAVDAGTTGEGAGYICLEESTKIRTDSGDIPIKEIVDKRLPVKVLGSSGTWQEILSYDKNPGKPLLEIETSDGAKLQCTEDHPIYIGDGAYMQAKDLILSCNDVSLYRLREEFRPRPKARSTVNSGRFLLQNLFRKVLQRPEQSGMVAGCYQGVYRLWELVPVYAGGSRSPLPLSPMHREETCSPICLPRLRKRVQESEYATNLLFDEMRWSEQSGQRQLPLHSRTEDEQIFKWVGAKTANENQGTRSVHLRDVLAEAAPSRCSPYGRLEDQSRSYKPSKSLQSVPFQTSHEDRDQSAHFEKVRIATIRRLPAPAFVYNIGVAPDHDYFANGILAHNCLDDPNDLKQMTSEAYVQGVIDYHETVLSSRLNDPKTGVRIVIQQRSSERDLTGHILSKEVGWEHLIIPMEYEGPTKTTSIGWSDWRKTEGELMCPERIGPAEIAEIKRSLGPVGYSGQYQQRPSPGEGAKFKREWWRFYNPAGVKTAPVRVKIPGGQLIEREPIEIPPAFEQVVQGWDMTFKESKDSDLVAGHAWGRVGANCFLLKRISDRMDFPTTLAAVRQMSAEYPCPEKLVEAKANGPAVVQTLRNEIPGMMESEISSGLESLATALTGYAEAGNMYLPNPDLYPWVWDLIDQFAVFPRGKHDDDVAAASHALRRLFNSISNSAAPEFRVIPRPGEPASARHIETDIEMEQFLQPHWRRWIAVAPGHPGAALWMAETPTRALRVYRELELEGSDAMESGRRVAMHSLADVRTRVRALAADAKVTLEVLLEKECFAPIEPIGSYAELFEQGMASFEPQEMEFAQREQATADMQASRVYCDMVELEDSVWDRLRDLLRFAPPDFKELDYNRSEAMKIYRQDREAYKRYMAAVEGRVHGEYPKIKFAASCKQTAAALGTAVRDEDSANPFLRALLIGISAPEVNQKDLKIIPWKQSATPRFHPIYSRGRRMRRAI